MNTIYGTCFLCGYMVQHNIKYHEKQGRYKAHCPECGAINSLTRLSVEKRERNTYSNPNDWRIGGVV